MVQKRLPPLNAIAAFEAAARLGSFTKAANDLNLTQSAISKQIQQLELRLGTPLFERRNKEVKLTASGGILLRAVSRSLQNIREAVREIDDLAEACVTIKATNGLASYFVIPFVSSFRRSFPTINVRIVATHERPKKEIDDADFAILYGDGDWDGVECYRLADERIYAVCSPGFKADRQIRTLSDVARCDLIELEVNDPKTITIRQWFREVGCQEPASGSIMRVSNYDLAIKAAVSGQGIALAWEEAEPEELVSGLLIRATTEVLETGQREYLARPSSRLMTKSAKTFWDWAVSRPR